MVADSHLVVRGHIVGVTRGSIEPFERVAGFPDQPVLFSIVQVDEVLKGKPESRDPGQVLVARLTPSGYPVADIPKDDVILFLKNYAQLRADRKAEPAKSEDDRYYYGRPNGYQALFVNRAGVWYAPSGPEYWVDSYGQFPWSLEGLQFDAVADQVRGIAAAE
jgi:hypothetical protein